MRKWLVFGMSVLGLAGSGSAAGFRGNYIAALVNDSIITRQEVEAYTEKSVDVLKRTFYTDPIKLQQKLDEAVEEGLRHLIERKLILDDFKKSGLVLPESYIDDEIKNRTRDTLNNRLSLTQKLHAEGLTTEEFRQRVREELMVRIMIQRNLQSAKLISPAKIQRFYQQHLEDYQIGEQVKLRMIFLGSGAGGTADELKQRAEELHSKIKQGASFVEMAEIYSEGSPKNGDWGWVERKKLNPCLADIAFVLQPTQLSDVVGKAFDGNEAYWTYQYRHGKMAVARKYSNKDVFIEEKKFEAPTSADIPKFPPQEFYVMLVEARQAPRTRDLAEVQDQIEKDLLVQEHETLRQKWLARLREKAFVRFF